MKMLDLSASKLQLQFDQTSFVIFKAESGKFYRSGASTNKFYLEHKVLI